MTGSDRDLPRLPQQVIALAGARGLLDRWGAVTVVRGIQGYGKTTTVAAWLRDQSASVISVWMSAKPGIADTNDFARALDAALARAKGLRDRSPALPAPGSLSAAQMLGQSAGMLSEGQRLVLVVDDAQYLRDRSLLDDLLDVVASTEHLHVVLCSRGRHPVETLALGRVELVTVPARELLLPPAQIVELASAMDVALSGDEAEHLYRAVGGWAAAARLVLDEVKQTPSKQLPLSRAEHYLANVVLPGIGDQETLHTVARFALAERLTHRLIRDLAPPDTDPAGLVRLIESPGLAERIYHENDVELVYPTFIRDCLREMFRAWAPDEARAMHRDLSVWYLGHPGPNHTVHALSHAVHADDWDQLDRIWQQRSAHLVFEHLESLSGLLAAVDSDVMSARPSLAVAAEMSRATKIDHNGRDGHEAVLRTYVEAATRIPDDAVQDRPLHELVFLGCGQVMGARLEFNLDRADQLVSQFVRTAADRTAQGEDPGDHLPCLYLQQGTTRTLRGDDRGAVTSYGRCWDLRREAHSPVAANAAAKLAMTHALNGEHTFARQWLARYQGTAEGSSWGQVFGLGATIANAVLAFDELDNGRCVTELEILADQHLDFELWPFLAFVRAQVGLYNGEPTAALSRLDSSRRSHPSGQGTAPAARTLITRARADLLMASGQAHQAHRLLRMPEAEMIPRLAVPLARLALLTEQPAEASRIAANLLWRDTVDSRSRLELLLINACAARRMGDAATSIDMTKRAVALSLDHNLLRLLTVVGQGELGELLSLAEEVLPQRVALMLAGEEHPFPSQLDWISLTPREHLLIEALFATSSRQEIAERLYVSVNTVRSQLVTLYRKLQVNTREDALARVTQLGLVGTHR